jgi:hypothetical protein
MEENQSTKQLVARLEVFIVMRIHAMVLWVTAQCGGVVRYQRFRGPYCSVDILPLHYIVS